MSDKRHIKQYITIALLITFLIGKVVDLHAHGHIETPHSHSGNPDVLEMTHHHNEHHGDKDTHLVNIMTDLPNMMAHSDSEHGHKTFDIETDAVTKQKNSSVDFAVLFLFTFLLIGILFTRKTSNIRPLPEFRFSFQQRLFAKNYPLRAPPFLA